MKTNRVVQTNAKSVSESYPHDMYTVDNRNLRYHPYSLTSKEVEGLPEGAKEMDTSPYWNREKLISFTEKILKARHVPTGDYIHNFPEISTSFMRYHIGGILINVRLWSTSKGICITVGKLPNE